MKKYIALLIIALFLNTLAFGSLTNFPNGVSSFGMPVIGGGGLMTTGKVFFVSSSNVHVGSNANSGVDSDQPFKTLDYAIGNTSAGRGDIIFVMPSHAEVIATGSLTLDISDISIIGLGSGSSIPNFTIGSTGTGASINVTSANISISKLRFTAGIDGLWAGFNVLAGGFTINECLFNGSSSEQVTNWIVVSQNVDDLKLIGNRVRQTAPGGASFIRMGNPANVGNLMDNTLIRNNDIDGDFSSANIFIVGTANALVMEYNIISNLSGVGFPVSVNSSTSGNVRYNSMRTNVPGYEWISPSSNNGLSLFENYGVTANGRYGRLIGN